MIKTDRNGKWEVHSGVRFLIEPSAKFEERRRLDRIASEETSCQNSINILNPGGIVGIVTLASDPLTV